jgi:prepilin-type N-terminal cleavage/methylation domain-containing protein
MFHTKKNLRIRLGFTLLELIIVLAMFSFVSVAVYTAFSNGVRIWQRFSRIDNNQRTDIFLERFCRDVANAFKFKDINFTGTSEGLACPGLVLNTRSKITSVGRIIYFFDPEEKKISRFQQDYSQIYLQQKSEAGHSLPGVKSFALSFYTYDKQQKKYLWVSGWEAEKLPLAVRIEIETADNINPVRITRTVDIPVGGN